MDKFFTHENIQHNTLKINNLNQYYFFLRISEIKNHVDNFCG